MTSTNIETTLRRRINTLALTHGGLRGAASALDLDPGYLSRLASGDKDNPSEEVLKKLGLRREVRYYRTF